LIYTNYEGDGIDLKGYDDGDVDSDEDTSPHAKGVLVAMIVSISYHQWS
jgi:hypothetical protein